MEELDYQQKFEQLFTTHIRREGAEQLLELLKKTDFLPRLPAPNITVPVSMGW